VKIYGFRAEISAELERNCNSNNDDPKGIFLGYGTELLEISSVLVCTGRWIGILHELMKVKKDEGISFFPRSQAAPCQPGRPKKCTKSFQKSGWNLKQPPWIG